MLDEPFELHAPTTVPEALAIARDHPGEYRYFAGGTDLLPSWGRGLGTVHHLISLERIPELAHIDPESGRIGAMVRLAALAAHPYALTHWRAVAEGAGKVASPQVRAGATVGGNLLLDTRCLYYNQSQFWRKALGDCLKTGADVCRVVPNRDRCYAVFAGDLAAPLLVLGAAVRLMGREGPREVPLSDLYPPGSDGKVPHALKEDELLLSVTLPPTRARSSYSKLTAHAAADFPEAGVALALTMAEGKVTALRLALGAVESQPLLFDDLTRALEGAELRSDEIDTLAEKVVHRVRPVGNTSLPADYRKHMVGYYIRTGLRALQGQWTASGP